jgi:putative nucleotidyltransferase with HDIG domain
MLRTRVRVGLTSALILSFSFAALLTAVGGFELFFPGLTPMFGEPAPLALRVPYSVQLVKYHADPRLPGEGGELYDVTFTHRRVVIPRGTVLSEEVEEHRAAVSWDEARRPPNLVRMTAAFTLYFVGCLILTSYFVRFGHSRLRLLRSQVGLIALMALTIVFAKLLIVVTTLPAFWIPVSALSFWASLAFDRRTALLAGVALSFMAASLLRFDLVLLTVFLTRTIIATLLFLNRKHPRQMLLAGIASGVAAALAFSALTVLIDGPDALFRDFRMGFASEAMACAGGGILSGVLANVLRDPAEQMMGHVPRTRLLDLTDIESPLLRKMATEAPGSWEHSRAMANLAEAASASVGADSLLTRVGAYYHDLGKTIQPKYFVENLAPGERSPHDDLPPEVSADAIMAHVVLGAKILRDEGVPEPVVEFAYTHHGTQLVEFFWNKYQKQLADRPADAEAPAVKLAEGHFKYPGMKPMTKETAVLMLVDSIEAASRTVQPPEHDKFEEMIQRIVFQKVRSGQLDDSGLTITDLRIMTQRMAATLVNMYHGRIKYPWQRKKEEEEARASARTPTPPPSAATPPPPPVVKDDKPAEKVSDKSDATEREAPVAPVKPLLRPASDDEPRAREPER